MTTPVPSWPALLQTVGDALVFSVPPVGVRHGGDVPQWDLTLTIRPLVSEDPRSYARRLRELLKLVETAILARDRKIRTEIIACASMRYEYVFTDEDFERSCLLSHVRLKFQCGASLEQVEWLYQFVSTFFQPFEELSTSTESVGQLDEQSQRVGVVDEAVSHEEEFRVRKNTFPTCYLSFATVDESKETWGEAEATAFMEFILFSSSHIRQEFANVWQLGDWKSVKCEVLMYADALPINAALVELMPSIAESILAYEVALNLSRDCVHNHQETGGQQLTVTYMRQGAAGERFGVFDVNGGVEAQGEKAIQLCQVISDEQPLLPMCINGLRVKKESLAHVLSTLLANATGLRLIVDRAGKRPIDDMRLRFEYTTSTIRSHIQTLDLRTAVDFEQFDEVFEAAMQLIGQRLRILEVKDAGLLEAGFSSILDFCPVLKSLSVSDTCSSMSLLVGDTSRRVTWAIQKLHIRMTTAAVDPLFTALRDPNHPITAVLTELRLDGRRLEGRRYEPGNPAVVEFRRWVECLPRIRSPLALKYYFRHRHSMDEVITLIESMKTDGAFDVHVPLPLLCKYAFLSSVKTSLHERGILETIFRFAGSPATHTVKLDYYRRR
ncbi:hypothetical protein Poli38472_011188 [Pythium oligandrum]|uniref:Uncharacterized protein n=1 Tax=Pythium oligandrum TaxID=41045 RepID=A0A8K1CSM2_PYTOL|nr:hypothetical protein Poli38472_011188 [Pythium oligandrum]|eukprot:TMW67568.1 hypothetical protein Poli38472_011188 [Pythium oligandrum]